MHISLNFEIFIILSIGLAGALIPFFWIRCILWLLSMPTFFIGCYALWQGGIAEPFSTKFMIEFCLVMFSPLFGCSIGQIILLRKKFQKSGEHHQNKT